jgi:hypothetical protein
MKLRSNNNNNQSSSDYSYYENISLQIVAKKRPQMLRTFKRYVYIAFLLGTGLLLMYITVTILTPNGAYKWVKAILRITIQSTRSAILAWILFRPAKKTKVEKMVGTGLLKKSIKAMAYYPPMGFWALMGVIEFFVSRFIFTLLDLFFLVLYAIGNIGPLADYGPYSIATTIAVDFLSLLEFPLSYYLVYSKGIVANVNNSFAAKKKGGGKIMVTTTSKKTGGGGSVVIDT